MTLGRKILAMGEAGVGAGEAVGREALVGPGQV